MVSPPILLPLNSTGLIIGNISTVNERVGESIDLIKGIWKKFAEEGPTGQEMMDAKDYINGSFALRFTNSSSIAAVLTALQRFELGLIMYYVDLVLLIKSQ